MGKENMKEKNKPINEQVINYKGVKAMPFIIGNEAFEKLGAIGCLANLIVYLTGVFNMKNITAATLLSIFNGTTNMAPLLGAFLCDTYFGRYKTLAFASICSLSGLTVLALTAAIPKLHPPKCLPSDMGKCVEPTRWQMGFLLLGFGFLVIGAGGIRPCNLTFGVDQFNPATESGRKGINSFFNWKRRLKLPDNPALSLYNFAMPTNSINSRLPYTDQLRCLNKAAIVTSEDEIDSNGNPANPWRLCSVQQVEEAKCVVRVMPLGASAMIYFVAVCLQYSYFILQAQQADRRLGSSDFQVPAASFVAFSMLGLTIWIPIYDRILVPALRKITGKEGGITLLQRMGIGILLSILTMIVAGLVEEHRRHLALTRPTLGMSPKGGKISSMSSFWLVPQLMLAGLTEAFNSIGQIEFYYKQFPENMRSIAQAFFFLGLAGSSYVSGLLISVVHRVTRSKGQDWLPEDLNKGRLDYFYYMVAALGVLNMGYFLVFATWYKYKDTANASTYEMSMATTEECEKHFV